MKIYNTRRLDRLTDIITHCTSPVYMVLDGGRSLDLQRQPDTLALFQNFCCCKDTPEIELNFSNLTDARRVLEYLIGA